MKAAPVLSYNTARYVLITAIAVLFSWVLHEFGHWAAGRALGLEMTMSLNKTHFPETASTQQQFLVTVAGPVITILEAIIVFWLLRFWKNIYLYPFLFTCFYMRLFATVISFRKPNDEARISESLGWGTFTLPIVISLGLLMLLTTVTTRYHIRWRLNLLTLLLIILFSSLLILGDQYWHPRLL